MKKTLSTIQILFKLGKILSTIAFVCSIVAASLSLVGLVCLAAGAEKVFKIGGVTIHGIVANKGGMTTDQMISAIAVWLVVIAAEAVLAWFAKTYFKRELTAGTPFTQEGAKELTRLGILTIVLPLGANILAAIINGILAEFLSNTWKFDVDNGGLVSLGIMFLVLALVCRYAAELEQEKTGIKQKENE
ncbi:MAG: hypothetical protein Q4F41_07970 [Eubacteriales bacterium]|nr:hypothetical protein [Eubacteriales bacterium]